MSTGYIRGASRETSLSKTKASKSSRQYGGQVQNVKSARVYVFGDEEIFEDESGQDDVEMSEIRSRRGQASSSRQTDSQSNEPLYLEKELIEGDTLQNVALQYACPVSELKRINNLIRDQDFYGLRVIKVPIKKYGMLSEILEEGKKKAQKHNSSFKHNGRRSLDGSENFFDNYDGAESTGDFIDPETQLKVIRTLSIKENLQSQSREAEEFLKNMDQDLSRIRQSHKPERNSLSEVISVLTNKSIHPLQPKKTDHLNDADCGIRWWSILIVILVLALIIPLMYVLYIYFWKSS